MWISVVYYWFNCKICLCFNAIWSGFNPTWEETLVFTLHMPQIALVRFMVWDHDPIGRDFIGQRTISFKSMMPGNYMSIQWHYWTGKIQYKLAFLSVIQSLSLILFSWSTGYRHVYLEGMEEASIFVHVAFNDITGKVTFCYTRELMDESDWLMNILWCAVIFGKTHSLSSFMHVLTALQYL